LLFFPHLFAYKERELAGTPLHVLREQLFFFVITNQHKSADEYLRIIRKRKPTCTLLLLLLLLLLLPVNAGTGIDLTA